MATHVPLSPRHGVSPRVAHTIESLASAAGSTPASTGTAAGSTPSLPRTPTMATKSGQSQQPTASPTASSAPRVLAVSPHSSGPSHRFSTMMPLGLDARQAIPTSTAPDAKPDANRCYAGLTNGPNGNAARVTFWSECIKATPNGPASTRKVDTSQLSESLLSEIEMELEPGHFCRSTPTSASTTTTTTATSTAPADFSAVRRILQKEAALSEREMLGAGHAHLASRVFLACERQEARALDIFYLLTSKLRFYEQDDWSALRNDVLRLTDMLLSHPNGAQLCAHFDALGFDLVDLSDVIVTWCHGLFASEDGGEFPTDFCLRCMDLVLWLPVGGIQHLIGVLYGVLHVIQLRLLACTTSEEVFQSLADLPATLTKAQIGEVFAQAYWTLWVPSQKKPDAPLPYAPEVDWHTICDKLGGALRFQTSAQMKHAIASGGDASASAPIAQSSSTAEVSTERTVSAPSGLALTSPAKLSTTSAALATAPSSAEKKTTTIGGRETGHRHSSSLTYDLADLPEESRQQVSLALLQNQSAVSAAVAAGTLDTPTAKSTAQATANNVTTVQPSTGGTPFNDATLLNDLIAATSSSSAPKHTPAQLQALLTRALKELQVQQSRRPSMTATTAGAISAIPLATPSGNVSVATQGVRSMSQAIFQIQPLEVHATHPAVQLDAASSGTGGAFTAATTAAILKHKLAPSPTGVVKYSELLEHQLYPTLLMQGYLMKSRAPSKLFKRRGSSGFFGNLHRRFFVLQGSFLTYFKSHEFSKPTRDESVDLRTCVATRIKNHEFAPFAFQISSREKGNIIYLLFASNETVRDVWLECLSQATQVPTQGV